MGSDFHRRFPPVHGSGGRHAGRRPSRAGRALALLAGAALAMAAGGARAGDLSFHDAVSAAWAIDPVRSELTVNRDSADARADAAKSWFPGGPVLSAQYYDDHAIGTNIGYTTYQGGVSVPLWLPGQGSATTRVAQAESAAIQERMNVEHMVLAVRVLDAAGALVVAQRRQAVALSLVQAMQRIDAAVARAAGAGESTLADRQAVEAELAGARNEVGLAREQVASSAAALAVLLGRDGLPDIMTYDSRLLARTRLDTPQLIEDNDPRVRASHRATLAAEDGVKLARASFMPNPEVGIGAIHEGSYGSPWDDRVGVNISVPLPSAARNVPMMADARNRLAAADSQERQARRMVRVELAQVRARLEASGVTLDGARASAGALNRRADELERSWKVGETSLVEALRARQAAYNAILSLNAAEVGWHAAIVRAAIAAGMTP
ncbi:TolC family protein [Gluconacetobacter tumulisoli]|uniref:TolC family protein n=1 Tax=Gluconacetobacter tumulisoli TaxID=1286189 RepID=A0A7W4K8F6_9PROT|nr:TolC family protein [Gluconacetobacter tumulisoli]MBB2202302.1 TolC family protein [Gluconacetobacter tumulisoli]